MVWVGVEVYVCCGGAETCCHAPNPGPTRLADPNRFPGCETQDWDSLPDFFFFFKTELRPVGMAHIL